MLADRRIVDALVAAGAGSVADSVAVLSTGAVSLVVAGSGASGSDVLELIEVQSGDYLGEDDIVRYEDVYGRS